MRALNSETKSNNRLRQKRGAEKLQLQFLKIKKESNPFPKLP
jgi:hypothetical protein